MSNLIKPFTITTAGMVAGLIIGKVFSANDKKRKNEIAKAELERLHKIQETEIKKYGKVSDETRKMINSVIKNTLD